MIENTPSTDNGWYAIYVKSRHEFKVAELLTRKGIKNTFPVIKKMKQWSDRKKVIKAPLFRGYVFVHIDLKHDKIHTLRTEGVVKFIGIKNEPSRIPEKQIAWLEIITDYNKGIKTEKTFQIGEKVKVIYGPFKGLEGTEKQDRNSSR